MLAGQLSDAVKLIADADYPHDWPALMSKLAERSSATDMGAVNGVLETAAAVLRRFDGASESEEVVSVLKAVLDDFAAPLREVTRRCHAEAVAAHGAGNLAALGITITALANCANCLASICSPLLPEVIEDHLDIFFGAFHWLLTCVLCHCHWLF